MSTIAVYAASRSADTRMSFELAVLCAWAAFGIGATMLLALAGVPIAG